MDKSHQKPRAYGLDGLVVADTKLSEVDGQAGRLKICGFQIEELAPKPFEAVCFLLWQDRLPNSEEQLEFKKRLGVSRLEFFKSLPKDFPKITDCMDFMRWSLTYLPEHSVSSSNPKQAKALDLAAALCVAAALWWRHARGLAPVPPDPKLNQAEDYLHMLSGKLVDANLGSTLNHYLSTVADHGMNASTFALRVVASTGSDLTSAVIAAMGALKGPLHGGAPAPVLAMFQDVAKKPDQIEAWVEHRLQSKQRIMGLGHRQYRVRDPRVTVFEGVLQNLEKKGFDFPLLPVARELEKVASAKLSEKYPDRPMRANVEFFTALLLNAVGVPAELFTATFALGRVAGWCAHFQEQVQYGKLIYPDAKYIGR